MPGFICDLEYAHKLDIDHISYWNLGRHSDVIVMDKLAWNVSATEQDHSGAESAGNSNEAHNRSTSLVKLFLKYGLLI